MSGNESVRERHRVHDFTHTWSLRSKTSEQKKGRQPKTQTLNYGDQAAGHLEGGAGVRESGDGGEEYTCCDELRVTYGTSET